MNVSELCALLAQYDQTAEVKLSVYGPIGSIGGADLSIEPSEDWSNAIVIFADAETP